MGCVQAFCEFNLFYPEAYEALSLKEKKDAFRIFWESGIARVGDVNGLGSFMDFENFFLILTVKIG